MAYSGLRFWQDSVADPLDGALNMMRAELHELFKVAADSELEAETGETIVLDGGVSL
jgi:hypothetical protein